MVDVAVGFSLRRETEEMRKILHFFFTATVRTTRMGILPF
jgi:hypothetical protein